jgi:TonB-dependent starch-binding outer membrane protein SusC
MLLPRWTRVPIAALVLCFGLLAADDARAQEPYRIQGTVVDATTQRPLTNVQILLRGTQQGTLSDNAGRFTLIARVQPGTYTLVFSLIGRGEVTQPITLGQERSVQVPQVTLRESAVQLEEIVVTGQGAPVERRAVANAVSTVAGTAINEAPGAPAIDAALQGKVVGAVITQNHGQPGGGTSIRLRGTSSILGGAEPLVVIDGVIVDNNAEALVSIGANATRQGAAMQNRLADIAPADIERIEILKGAAAAALYGSRANNGVIQIFTKRGQEGRPVVTYRTEAGTSWTDARYQLNQSPVAGRGDVVYGGAPSIGAQVQRFLYQDDLFRRGARFDNQLSISGGAEGTRYYLSGTWTNETGILQGSENSRVNARVRVDQQVAPWLEVGGTASYIQNQTNYIPEGEQSYGVLTALISTPTTWNPNFRPDLGRYPYSPIFEFNPFDVLENFRTETNVNRFLGGATATLTPLPNLTINYIFGLDQAAETAVFFQPPRSRAANDPGLIQNPTRNIRRFNNDLTVNHVLQVNPGLQLNTTLGFRQTQDRSDEVRAAAQNLPPGQTTVGGATQFASQFISELRTVGGFIQERVSLGNRLFLTGGVNFEAASAFGPDERWQLFPRLGVSYVIHDEPFWRASAIANTLSTLRLRASYGETGGQPPGAFLIFDNYNNVARGGLPGLVPSPTAGNPALRPERQRELEGGFELGLFDNRAEIEFTAYNQRTRDLVLGVPLAPGTGYTQQFQNIGTLSNRGIEVALNTVNLQRQNFSWRSRISYATNRERVEELIGTADTLLFGYLNHVMIGQPVGVFYGPVYPRDAQGNRIIAGARDARGRIVPGTEGLIPSRTRALNPLTGDSTVIVRQIVGSPVPDFTAALSNEFQVGPVQLSFLLDGRFGNDIVNFSRRISEYFGAGRLNEQEQCVTATPIGATAPTLYCPYTLNLERHTNWEEFIEDASFVKLREVALRFRLDQPWVRTFGARTMDLRIAGRNLFTWTNYTGVDPEINMFSASTVARGVDFATTPIPRTIAVGATFNF